jgi:hypothetical protein
MTEGDTGSRVTARDWRVIAMPEGNDVAGITPSLAGFDLKGVQLCETKMSDCFKVPFVQFH